MNSPIVMRNNPGAVSDAFHGAMKRIEQLRSCLERPKPVGAETFDKWFDVSIFDGGLKRMVELVLLRHMLPFVKELPEIFHKDLKYGTDNILDENGNQENLLIREIREANCMGSMVLLYYYLLWHMLLVLINDAQYPCQSKSKTPWKSNKELTDFFRMLPRANDLLDLKVLEFHEFKESNKEVTPKIFMDVIDEEKTKVPQKKLGSLKLTDTCIAYKSVLYHVFASLGVIETRVKKDERMVDIQPPYWVLVLGDNNDSCDDLIDSRLLRRTTLGLCRSVKSMCVLNESKLFGKIISMFSKQDEIQKWYDMHSEFEIRSDDIPQDHLSGAGPEEATYIYRLADLLMQAPYTEDKKKGLFFLKSAAIYDFSSASLMMDVSISFLALSSYIEKLMKKSEQALEHCILFLVMSIHTDHQLNEQIKMSNGRNGGKSKQHMSRFIMDGLSAYKKTETIENSSKFELTVDNLAGYYWGCRHSDMLNSNHRYLSWPDLCPEIDNQKRLLNSTLFKVQNYCNSPHLSEKDFLAANAVIQPAIRNSLFQSNLLESLKRFIDKTECHSLFPKISTKVEASWESTRNIHIKAFIKMLLLTREDGIYHGPPFDITGTTLNRRVVSIASTFGPELIKTGHSELKDKSLQFALEIINKELAQLKMYEAEQKNFTRYTGVSWPVFYNSGAANNFDSFTWIRRVVKPVPPVSVSVNSIARRLDGAAVLGANFVMPEIKVDTLRIVGPALSVAEPPASGSGGAKKDKPAAGEGGGGGGGGSDGGAAKTRLVGDDDH